MTRNKTKCGPLEAKPTFRTAKMLIAALLFRAYEAAAVKAEVARSTLCTAGFARKLSGSATERAEALFVHAMARLQSLTERARHAARVMSDPPTRRRQVTAARTVLDFARQHARDGRDGGRLAALESLQGVSGEPEEAPGRRRSSRKCCAGIPVPESSRWRARPLTLAQWARQPSCTTRPGGCLHRAPSRWRPPADLSPGQDRGEEEALLSGAEVYTRARQGLRPAGTGTDPGS